MLNLTKPSGRLRVEFSNVEHYLDGVTFCVFTQHRYQAEREERIAQSEKNMDFPFLVHSLSTFF